MKSRLFHTLFLLCALVGMSACANIDEEESSSAEEFVTVSQQLKRGMVICKPSSVRPHTHTGGEVGEDGQPVDPVDEEIYEEECTEPGEETTEKLNHGIITRRQRIRKGIRKKINGTK